MKIKSSDFFNKILFALKSKAQTVSQIANGIGTNWESTKNHVEQLEEMGFLIKTLENNKDYYQINPNPQSKKDFGTYFNLPVEQDVKETLETLYFLIRQEWIKITNKRPTITQIYKTLAKLDVNKNLNLPIGWYNFGKIPIVIYKEDEIKEEKAYISSDVKEEIPRIVEEYSKYGTIRKLLQHQYREFDKTSYELKETLLDNFYYSKNKFLNEELKTNFKNFIKALSSDDINKNYTQYVNEFYNLLIHFDEVENNSKPEEFCTYKEVLIETFKELFKFISLDYYKKSLMKFYENEILELSFKKDIKSQKLIVEEKLSEVLKIIENTVKPSKIYRTYLMNNNFQSNFERITENELQSPEEQEQMLKDLGL